MATDSDPDLPLCVPPPPIFGDNPLFASNEKGEYVHYDNLVEQLDKEKVNYEVMRWEAIESVMRNIGRSLKDPKTMHLAHYLFDASLGRPLKDLLWTLFIVADGDFEAYYTFGSASIGRLYPAWLTLTEEEGLQNNHEVRGYVPTRTDMRECHDMIMTKVKEYVKKKHYK